jgi:hypothetical protein
MEYVMLIVLCCSAFQARLTRFLSVPRSPKRERSSTEDVDEYVIAGRLCLAEPAATIVAKG